MDDDQYHDHDYYQENDENQHNDHDYYQENDEDQHNDHDYNAQHFDEDQAQSLASETSIEQCNLSDNDAEDPDDPTPYNSQDYNTSGSSISLSPPGSDIDCADTTDLDHDTSNEYDSPLDPDSQSSFSGYSRDS